MSAACTRRKLGTWILALGIDTGQAAGTVAIVAAHWLYGSALAVGIGIAQWHLFRTATDGTMLQRLADSILSAGTLSARTHTLVSNAGQIGGTIVIRVTFQTHTAHKWISLKTSGTTAASAMVSAITLSIQSTRIGDQAGIDTLMIHALFVTGALIVRLASNRRAAELGITREAGLAIANRMMILDRALGIGATVAGINALRVDARLGNGAIRVRLAAHSDDIRSCK